MSSNGFPGPTMAAAKLANSMSTSGYAWPQGTFIANTGTDTSNGIIKITGDNPDIVIGEKSISKWMQKVEERLAILEPKPGLLAKYENLREAYEHYKTLEALLVENESGQ